MTKADPFTLSPREEAFIEAFLEHRTCSTAAVAAGYSPANAPAVGGKVRWRPRVAAAIDAAQKARAERLGLSSDRIVQALIDIAFADAAELVQYRRVNCRHCHGEGHAYQHTAPEQAARRRAFEADTQPRPFDEQGGEAFDAWADPNPDCPQCQGYGVGEMIINDTRLLSEEGRALFAGMRKTIRGAIEIKTHDRVAALVALGRHIGMFTGKVEAPQGETMLCLEDTLRHMEGLPPIYPRIPLDLDAMR